MIPRYLMTSLQSALDRFPVVTMVGSRQVGKTTLAKQIAKTTKSLFFDLENPRDQLILEDPLQALSSVQDKLVIIDEAQRNRDLFPVLRVLIDENRRPGRFLLLGSASPDLRRQSAESLAGRNKTLVLHPFNLLEAGVENQSDLWVQGGFPLSFLSENKEFSMEWRREFLKDLIERDLRLLGFEMHPDRMRRFMLMLAHLHGQSWNASKIARSTGLGTSTVTRYLDSIQQTLLVTTLMPYYANLGKRLIKSPKLYLSDSGLHHCFMGLPAKNDILGHPCAGASWEGFVLQQIRSVLPEDQELMYWRTAAGAEIDILVLSGNQPKIAIECKLNTTRPAPRRGFTVSCDDLDIEQRWVAYPGDKSFALPNNIQVKPLKEILVLLS